MKGIDPQNDLVPSPPNCNLDSVFCNELNLSTIDPPMIEYKGLWKTLMLRANTCMVLNLMLTPWGTLATKCIATSQGTNITWSWTNFAFQYL